MKTNPNRTFDLLKITNFEMFKVAQNSSCIKNLKAYSSKLLSKVFIKELVFTKYLLIYLLLQTEAFNPMQNMS